MRRLLPGEKRRQSLNAGDPVAFPGRNEMGQIGGTKPGWRKKKQPNDSTTISGCVWIRQTR
jgi:hypothetical protein